MQLFCICRACGKRFVLTPYRETKTTVYFTERPECPECFEEDWEEVEE